MKTYIGQARHEQTSLWVTARRRGQIPEDIWSICQWACLFRCTDRKTSKDLASCFGQECDSDEQFQGWLKKLKKPEFILYERDANKPYSRTYAGIIPPNWAGFNTKPSKAPGK
jgi:hypothetical protein